MAMMFSLISCGGEAKDASKPAADTGPMLSVELSGEITVCFFPGDLFSERYIKEAIYLFEFDHPGVTINIAPYSIGPDYEALQRESAFASDIPMSGDDAVTMDYINRVNTELISGKGPDILSVDSLPYYKYAESGAFEDLLPYIEADEDFNISDYQSTILEGTRYRSGQYMIPVDYTFRFVSFDKDRVDSATAAALREKSQFTWWELTDMIREQFMADGSDARVINYFDGAARAFYTVFLSEYTKYVDLENKKAHFTDSDFTGVLQEIDWQRANGYFSPISANVAEFNKDIQESQGLYYLQYEVDYILPMVFSSVQDPGWYPIFPYPDVDEIAGILVNDAGKAWYGCYQAYGMNANSPNKELAWAFLKYLLSEEMQQSSNIMGHPVHNEAFIDRTKKHFADSIADDGRRIITKTDMIAAYNDYMQCLDGFIGSLSYYPVTDWVIRNMVEKEVRQVFDGTKTAEEAATALQNRVQLYLNE